MQLASAKTTATVLRGDDMHRTRFIFGISVLFLAAGIVVTAQQGSGGPKSTHTTTPAKPNPAPAAAAKPAPAKAAPATATSAKGQAAQTSKPAAQATTTTPPKTAAATPTKSQAKPGKPDVAASKTTTKSPAAAIAKSEKAPVSKTAKADAKPAKSAKISETKVAKADKKTDKPSKTTPATTQLTPVQQKLKDNTSLAGKIESMLPKGTSLMAAADGFRDLGQFVAAVNVANNLNVSFDELKTKIVTNKMSLGQAIQAVRPLTASPTIEAQRAEYDARGLIAETAQAEASPAPKTHGPVTTGTSTSTTSNPVKTKAKTTKTSAQ